MSKLDGNYNDEIKELNKTFDELVSLAEVIPELYQIKKTLRRGSPEFIEFKKGIKDTTETIYNKFSKVELLLRDIKKEIDTISNKNKRLQKKWESAPLFEYSFKEKLILNEKEYLELHSHKDIEYKRVFVWIWLFIIKVKDFEQFIEEYLNNIEKYSPETIDIFLQDISHLYRQIKVMYQVILGESFTQGTILNKIEIKTDTGVLVSPFKYESSRNLNK